MYWYSYKIKNRYFVVPILIYHGLGGLGGPGGNGGPGGLGGPGGNGGPGGLGGLGGNGGPGNQGPGGLGGGGNNHQNQNGGKTCRLTNGSPSINISFWSGSIVTPLFTIFYSVSRYIVRHMSLWILLITLFLLLVILNFQTI